MRDDAPVVITGTGAVCALGWGVDELMDGALAGRTGIRPCGHLLAAEGFPGSAADPPSRWPAGTVPEEAGNALRGSRSTRYALAATEEALRAARLLDGAGGAAAPDRDRVGVVAGSAAPSADLYFALGQHVMTNGLGAVDGRVAPNLSAHAPAAAIALTHGFRGPNLAVSAACATGTLVLLSARDQILAGRADVVVVVAAESAVTAIGLESFASAKALGAACRPFDSARDGLVFGEGAAALVVERASHAAARGVEPLATVLGGALTNDASHMWRPDAGSWARTMRLALADADVDGADIGYVCAHAPGTKAGDAAEVAAIRQTLGSRADEVPVWSTKGMHGHAFGASGGLETIIAIHALRAGRVPQTVGLTTPAADCDLDHVADPDRPGAPGLLLKDSFGFGGTNCVLVLDVHG
jgi:3-oxoacyl-[acyl-carrier-protein] synthase II